MLEDSGSGAFGGLGEPGDEAGGIQSGASVVKQSAVINSGANFGLELVFGDDSLFMIKVAFGFFGGAAEIVEMFWFASHLEVAAAGEIAGDIFFTDQFVHEIDGFERRRVHALSDFFPVACDQGAGGKL